MTADRVVVSRRGAVCVCVLAAVQRIAHSHDNSEKTDLVYPSLVSHEDFVAAILKVLSSYIKMPGLKSALIVGLCGLGCAAAKPDRTKDSTRRQHPSKDDTRNVFGIGLVSEGNQEQWNYAKQLAGDGGWIMLTFAGVDNTTTAPQQSWVDAVNGVQALGLNPVIRLSPPWGSAFYRSESDDDAHHDYTTLASAFHAVVAGLPLVDGQNIWIQVDNEPDLCYEWACATDAGSPLDYTTTAAEYAFFFSAVADSLHSIDSRIKVSAAPLAPGGTSQCGCCGQPNCPGDKPGITGLQFMQAMTAAVSDVWSKVDFLASHAYPASGVGYGFNVPLDQAAPGLTYYDKELSTIGRSDIPVLITETGWATQRDGLPPCTEQNKADWTAGAYNSTWLADERVAGVMPFMLQDAVWGDQDGYEYVSTNGDVAPVFTAVQQLRCAQGITPPC